MCVCMMSKNEIELKSLAYKRLGEQDPTLDVRHDKLHTFAKPIVGRTRTTEFRHYRVAIDAIDSHNSTLTSGLSEFRTDSLVGERVKRPKYCEVVTDNQSSKLQIDNNIK